MQQVALLTYERPLVGEPIQNSAVRSSATPVQQPSHGCTACVPLPAAAQKLQLLTAAGHDRGLYYWTHPIPPFSFSFSFYFTTP
jgi:hypothetical protein